MPFIPLIIVLVVEGVLLWKLNNRIPMDRKVKLILNSVVAVLLVFWLFSAFAVLNSDSSPPVVAA